MILITRPLENAEENVNFLKTKKINYFLHPLTKLSIENRSLKIKNEILIISSYKVIEFLKKMNRGDIFDISRDPDSSGGVGVTTITFDDIMTTDSSFKYLYSDGDDFSYNSVRENERRKLYGIFVLSNCWGKYGDR